MKPTRILFVSFLLLCLLPALAAAQTFTDALGREVTLAAPPRRIVAFEGSLAEAVLCCGGTLAGATEDAVSERGLTLAQDTAVVGTVKNPSLELTAALEPDFILLSADSSAHVALEGALSALDLPYAYFSFDTYGEYMDMAGVLCALLDREDLLAQQEETVRAPIEATIAAARAYSTGVKAKGSDSLAGAMLCDMGLVNLADGDGALLESLTLERILVDDPDYIFITTMGESYEKAMEALRESLTGNPAWASLTAVKEGRVIELPKALFQYKPNARWAEAYDLLWSLLYAP